MTIHISPLLPVDIEAVSTLARIVWQDTYPGIITQDQIDFMLEDRYCRARLLEDLENPDVAWDKATLDGDLAAFASTLLTSKPAEMKLDKLYVDPLHQRFGLGGRLIAHVS